MVSLQQPMTMYELISLIVSIAGFLTLLLALWFGKKQLDDLKITRHGETVKAIFEIWTSEEMYAAYTYTQRMKFKNWIEFKEHNPEGSKGWRQWMITMNYFNTIGILVKTRALSTEVARMMLKTLPRLWEKVLPLVTGYRSDFASPYFAEEFEWLYQDMIKPQIKS